MIDVGGLGRLGARERFALDQLVDASCILRAEDGARIGAVRVDILDESRLSSLASIAADASLVFGAAEGVVRIPRALLGLVADLLSQRADLMAPLDKRGRPASAANELVRAGVERTPVVSRVAIAFGEAVHRAADGRPAWSVAPWPGAASWAVALSHDLDVASLWPAFTLLRGAELARKGEANRLSQVVVAAASRALGDPVRGGVDDVLAAESDAGARSTWFILCGTPTFSTMRAGDLTYRPESKRVRGIVGALRVGGHEVALHGSLETVLDGRRFAAQRKRLEAIAGSACSGVRQHFLRRRIGETEQAMARAGFAYDSTCGFADRNGFRAGIADVFPMWDASQDAPVGIEQAPFCWMDRAQSKYQGIEDPARWIDDAISLAGACATVRGLWCGIWHPNLTPALGYPGATEAYRDLTRRLAAADPWLATLDEIVRWRVGRRSLRVVAVGSDGAPVVRGDDTAVGATEHPYSVVDGAGREALRVTGTVGK